MIKRVSRFALLGLVVMASAVAQDQVQWSTGADAVVGLCGGGGDKPILLFVTTRPKMLEKLGAKRGCFADPAVLGLSKDFSCVFYEKGDATDKDATETWNKLASSGLSTFSGKITLLDPRRIKGIPDVSLDKAKLLRAGLKGLKGAVITQLGSSVSGKALAAQMERALRLMKPAGKRPTTGKRPTQGGGSKIEFSEEPEKKTTPKDAKDAKDGTEGKDGKDTEDTEPAPEAKKPAPKPVKKDPALALVELARGYEAAGRHYAALTAYKQAARYTRSPLAAEAAKAVARIEADPVATAAINRQKADLEARRWLSVGKTHHRNGNYTQAATYYRKVLGSHGTHAVAAAAKLLLADAEASKPLR